MKRTGTLHFRLFIYYGSLITAIIFMIFCFFYLYIARTLEERAFQSIRLISSNTSSQLDDLITQMSSDSTKLLYSDTLKSMFYSTELYEQSMTSLQNQRSFNETFYSIMGPLLSVTQINIFHEDGRYISIGNYTAFSDAGTRIADNEWFQAALERDGAFYLSPPHLNEWSYYKQPVFSLYRAFSEGWGLRNDAIIEMQMDYSALGNICGTINDSQIILILNDDGALYYPALEKIEPELTYQIQNYQTHMQDLSKSGTYTTRDETTGINYMISYSRSGYSGLTVMVLENEHSLFTPIRIFRNNLMLIGLVALTFTLLISFFIARKVTVPIRRLYTSIRNLNLDTLDKTQTEYLYSSWNELELLNNSFLEMKDRLERSLEETISSKSHEIQAHMLALQSQMNPHFLYNTLTTISIMAENEGNTSIENVCNSLSDMLRYISTDDPNLVTMQEELSYTSDFLNLIKIRYKHTLTYDIHVPEDMLTILLPKMVVEPLVENCVKYAMNTPPPWKISIEGTLNNTNWQITVTDNGKGFTDEKLKELGNTFAHLDPLKDIPNLKLNGMGLINIFIRLKLQYGEAAIFKIKNLPGKGACITIGGTLSAAKAATFNEHL